MKVAKRENSILIDDNINYLIDLQVAREGLDTYTERQPFQQSLTGVKQTVEVAQHHQSVDPSLIQLNQKLVEAIAEIESYVIPNLERQLQLKDQVLQNMSTAIANTIIQQTDMQRKQIENRELREDIDTVGRKIRVKDM